MANSRVEEEWQRKSRDLFHSSLLEVRFILIDLRTHALTQSAEQNVLTRSIPYATEIIATVCIIISAEFFAGAAVSLIFSVVMKTGTTPKWEARLHLNLLTPGPLMQQLSNECRTIVLASGSLSPIPSLCAELNLFSEDDSSFPIKPCQSNPNNVLPNIQKRLQNLPSPLEADHVVNLDKQFFAVSIGHFPVSCMMNSNQFMQGAYFS